MMIPSGDRDLHQSLGMLLGHRIFVICTRGAGAIRATSDRHRRVETVGGGRLVGVG
jgi:hypothetical protein